MVTNEGILLIHYFDMQKKIALLSKNIFFGEEMLYSSKRLTNKTLL